MQSCHAHAFLCIINQLKSSINSPASSHSCGIFLLSFCTGKVCMLCHIAVLADAGDPQQHQATQPKKGTSADFSKKLDMFKQQTGSPVTKVCPSYISTRSTLRLSSQSCRDGVAQITINDSVACLLHSRMGMHICLDSGCMSCKTWATFPGIEYA